MAGMDLENCKTLDDAEALYPPRQGLAPGAEITRLAPSPTGMPHIGTAMQAILNRALADRSGGVFMLRIEDTDQARTIAGAQDAIIEGLNWLGAAPDEGCVNGGAYGPYIQSQRLPLYRLAAQYLLDQGHAYRCFCSAERLDMVRRTQTTNHQTPKYDRHCLHLSADEVAAKLKAGESFTVRQKIPEREKISITDEVRGEIVFDTSALDDGVLLKSDGFPTYHLAAVVDDHFMRVTTVVRGEEWIPSTPKHVLIYRAFGWQPPKFLHTVLLRDPQKRKLSKRSGDTSLTWFRRQGFLSLAFRNFLTRVMWAHPGNKDIYPFEEFVQLLDTKALPSTGPVADMTLLQFINNRYITAMSNEERAKVFIDYLDYLIVEGLSASSTIDPLAASVTETDPDFLRLLRQEASTHVARTVAISSIEPGRHHRLADMIFDNAYLYDCGYVPPSPEMLAKQAALTDVPGILSRFTDAFKADPHLSLDATLRAIAKDMCLAKDKQAFMTLRVALTGRDRTPPLPEVIEVLGADRVRQRLEQVMLSVTETAKSAG